MTQQSVRNSSKRDEEYKGSVQPIVDRAMEAQNLAPAIVVAIKENKPLNDELKEMFRETLEDDKKFNEKLEESVSKMIKNSRVVQDAIDESVSNSKAINESKDITHTKAFKITLAVSAIATVAAVAAVIVAIIALNK
ncbi:hypothetical protein IJG90_03655 [Candidatus Saccharibacteria bacterium]|nr:hypothetical protein [Candidatus Saccharibacteria bacterium]